MENAQDIQAAVESLTSMEAEQSVLGGILLDGLPAFARCDRLAAEMFYLAAHRLVYGVMAQMAADGLPLDVVTVGEALEARNLAAETGGMGYLVDLVQITPSAANIVRYAAIVESRYTERRLLAASAEIERIALDKSGESAEDKCSAAAAVLGKVNDTLLHKAETCQSYAQALGGTLDYMAQKRKGLQGISTGLADLDAITQGLQKGNLIVIAARPGMGKTVLAENIARHAAKQGLRVHFQSYEMSQRELVMRGMAAEAEIHFGSLKRGELDIEEIRRYLPHRYPFLLIDRITEVEIGSHIKAIKNVTANEPFFQGHFPGKAVMPGVLVIEAMAQAAGILGVKSGRRELGLSDEPEEDGIYFFVGIDKARFRRTVVPGDQLHFEIKIIRSRRGIWSFTAEARVDGTLVCEAEIMCTTAGRGGN